MSNQTKKLIICVVVLVFACFVVGGIRLLPIKENQLNQDEQIDSSTINEEDVFNVVVPWEDAESKRPIDYTREEYESLSPAQKEEFKNSFINEEELNNWQEKEEVIIEKYPWETGGKTPEEYSLSEYEALTIQQKVGFKKYFVTQSRFDEWLLEAKLVAETYPWEQGGKQPTEYTFKEYLDLNEIQRIKFERTFKDVELFREWYIKAEEVDYFENNPWYSDGRQPSDFTLEEYNLLTENQKETFKKTFSSEASFNAWHENVLAKENGNPWETDGKQPSEYTLDEFNSLTKTQQIAFQKSFKTEADFEAWLSKVSDNNSTNNPESAYPWEQGGKNPDEYTYSEFNSLTGEQQIAFQNWFKSSSDFDSWMKKVQGSSSQEKLPWENGGKQPSEYTFEEFNALTGSQQIAFQNSFGSNKEFETWLNNVQGNSSVTTLPWETGGKLPNEYTFEEFSSLSGSQQIAFQKWFNGSLEFETWLSDAQNSSVDNAELPWENGGKQPQEYTWAEFEALSGPQQIAFQNYFENFEDFEDWMNSALSE